MRVKDVEPGAVPHPGEQVVDIVDRAQGRPEPRSLGGSEPVGVVAGQDGDRAPRSVLGPCARAPPSLGRQLAVDRAAVDQAARDPGQRPGIGQPADMARRHPESVRCFRDREELTCHNR